MFFIESPVFSLFPPCVSVHFPLLCEIINQIKTSRISVPLPVDEECFLYKPQFSTDLNDGGSISDRIILLI